MKNPNAYKWWGPTGKHGDGVSCLGLGPKAAKCIIPRDQWDGDTGIDRLIEEYRSENCAGKGPKPKTVETMAKMKEYHAKMARISSRKEEARLRENERKREKARLKKANGK